MQVTAGTGCRVLYLAGQGNVVSSNTIEIARGRLLWTHVTSVQQPGRHGFLFTLVVSTHSGRQSGLKKKIPVGSSSVE